MCNLYNLKKIIHRKSILTCIDFQQSENIVESQYTNNSNVSTTVTDDTTEDTFSG